MASRKMFLVSIVCIMSALHLEMVNAKPKDSFPCITPLTCPKFCKDGFAMKTDKTGCTICVCKVICPPFNCHLKCPRDFNKDSKGCDTCDCRPPHGCGHIGCRIPCPYGHFLNEYGCATCRCKSASALLCAKNECTNNCIIGYQEDTNGCQTCDCIPLCRKNNCDKCPKGSIPDIYGCETCVCKE